ncbi:MAG: response regulator [Myxococcota bacterium]
MGFILVVEDNETNMELITTILDEEGHEYILARDGAAGLSMATEYLPDLVLMDVSLPLLNGLDATSALKREGRTRDIPVIALTAHAMRGDRERCLQAGCDDYETKPLDGPRLMKKISEHIAARPPEFVRLVEQSRNKQGDLKTGGTQLREAEARAEAAENRQAELERQVIEVANRLVEAERKTATLQTSLDQQKAALAAERDRAETDFEERLAFLKKRVMQSLNTSRERATTLQAQLDEAQAENSAARAAQQKAQESLLQVEADRMHLVSRLEELEARLAGAVSEAQLQALTDAHRQAVASLEEEHAQLLDAQKAEHTEQIEALKAEHAQQLAAAESNRTKAMASAQAEKKRQRKLAARSRRLAAEKRIQEAEATVEALRAELAAARLSQAQIPADTRLLQAELTRKTHQLAQTRSALARLQEAIRGAVDASFRESLYEPPLHAAPAPLAHDGIQ